MPRRGALLLVPLLCAPIFLAGLARLGLNDPDEGRNAEVAREMLATGDLVTPHINGAVYLDKPPVFFWSAAATMAIFGAGEIGARLPSALAAVAVIGLTVWFGRRRFGDRAAVLAGVVLALSPLFVVFGRLVIFDMLLLAFTAASTMAAYEAMEAETPRRTAAILFFVAAALGTLTKGPVALVVPLLVAATWAVMSGRPALLGRLRWGLGMPIYLAIVAPWPLLIEARHPGYLKYALLGENLARMAANPYETARPFHFYAKVIVPGLFPWLLLPAAQAVEAFARRLRRVPAAPPAPDARAARFVVIWLAVLCVFFSVITSKRPSYILPCAVPVALLAGRLIARAFENERARAVLASALVAIGVASVALAIGVWLAGAVLTSTAVADDRHAPLLEATGLFRLTAAALIAAAVILFLVRRAPRPAVVIAAAALPLLCLLPAARAASRQVEAARSSRDVSRYLAGRLGPSDKVVCYEEFRPGLGFYLRIPIEQVTRAGRIFTSNYIAAHADALRADPASRLVSEETLRGSLADASFTTYVLTPHKEYGTLKEAAGSIPLRMVWEQGGFGLFVPAAAAGGAGATDAPVPAGAGPGG
ncbi:MAG TPA: glycosyltransferase family 39 protein [Patescibacteria group bacterium]|nr:glycosyltransferase family 39 protein [Patescibacteria group bacterium]